MTRSVKTANAEQATHARIAVDMALRGTTISQRGIAQYATPHAHQVIMARNGVSLALLSDGRYAVGLSIRTSKEIPGSVTIFTSKRDAEIEFQLTIRRLADILQRN